MTAVLHVACAATPDHVAHSAAMLHSAATWRGGLPLVAHYLHAAGFPARDLRRLQRMATALGITLHLVEVPDAQISGLPRLERIPAMMWYRVLLPDLLPTVDRVLYLDTDVIVTDDLRPLWTTDLAGRPLAAVTNVVVEAEHRRHVQALGLQASGYLNSGVLLLDLRQMRERGLVQRLVAFGRETTVPLLFPEQDALSVVLGEERLPLHPRWNAMNSVLEFPEAADVFPADALQEACEHPGIRHFEGPGANKPWHYRCMRISRERYRHHRRQTPWRHYRPEGRTPRAVAGRARRAIRARLHGRRATAAGG